MEAEQLEMIALKAGCKVPRVMPRKKRDGQVVHALLFTCSKGRKDVEVALDATPEAAQAAVQAAMVA